MRGFELVLGLILLSGSVGFSATEKKVAGVRAHKISGLCPVKERKEKENCPLDLPEEPAREFSYFDFPAKDSKKIKTTATACSEKLVDEILKFEKPPEEVLKKSAQDKPSGPRFDPDACTVVAKASSGPQIAILELREFEKHSAPAPDSLQRQILLVALNSKGQPEKIIHRVLSVDTADQDRSLRQLHGICDVDGDQQGEIVLIEELRESSHFIVFTLNADFNEINEKKYLASGGCGAVL